MSCLSGLITASITPFLGENLDESGFRFLLRRQRAAGVDGVVVLGTTGESSSLTDEEREQVITIAVEELEGATPLIVGTGAASTRETLRQTQQAARLGADYGLVVTPYYVRPNREGLRRHFLELAHDGGLPLCLYDIPKRCGVALDLELQLELLAEPTICAIKSCSGDFAQWAQLVERLGSRELEATFLLGDDLLALPGMALGANGLISVASNFVPEELVALIAELSCGQLAAAQLRYRKLLPLLSWLSCETNPIPIKAAMELVGLPSGSPRLPLTSLPIDQLATQVDWLRQWVGVSMLP